MDGFSDTGLESIVGGGKGGENTLKKKADDEGQKSDGDDDFEIRLQQLVMFFCD